jgi:hypothetical protein
VRRARVSTADASTRSGQSRIIGSGSVAIQTQKQPLHVYVGTRMWPIRVGRTGRPFSSRHLGQMASDGGSGGMWLRRLDVVCVGGNRTFVLGKFPRMELCEGCAAGFGAGIKP